jgi:hypothetical protein
VENAKENAKENAESGAKSTQKGTDTKAPDIGKTNIPPTVKSLCRPVRSAKSAKKFLARLLVAYQRGEIDSQNARTSVYVLSEYLRAVEVSEFEERIVALEKQEKAKK